jgi:hypothetical protein
MDILIDTYEYYFGDYRLTITLYYHRSGEYSYNAVIDYNGALVSKVNTHKFTDMWRYFDSIAIRIKDFYETFSDGHET